MIPGRIQNNTVRGGVIIPTSNLTSDSNNSQYHVQAPYDLAPAGSMNYVVHGFQGQKGGGSIDRYMLESGGSYGGEVSSVQYYGSQYNHMQGHGQGQGGHGQGQVRMGGILGGMGGGSGRHGGGIGMHDQQGRGGRGGRGRRGQHGQVHIGGGSNMGGDVGTLDYNYGNYPQQ